MRHVLIDCATTAEEGADAAERLLALAPGAARAAGFTRLTYLRRASFSTAAATPEAARAAAHELMTPPCGEPPALAIATLVAPPRDRANPGRDGQRLGALAAELGADLLVTWDIPAAALSGGLGRTPALLLGAETQEGDGEATIDGILAAAWPGSESDLARDLERAGQRPEGRSPEQQARIQSAALAAFCEVTEQRGRGARAEPGTAAGADRPDAPTTPGAGVDDRNALLFWLGPRSLYREHLVSTREIVCGPDMETTFVDGRLATLNVPAGQHDFQRILSWLPADQRPDLVIVKADATGRNHPVHLTGVKCPRVLLVGDTHHLDAPLRRVLTYARSEPFDFVVIDHTRHHGHYFVEAGFENVAWLPAFDVSPHRVPTPAEGATPDPALVFVGQVSGLHPYRAHVLETLKAAGLPLKVFRAPPPEAARLYATSCVSLNASLNGDLNLRVFEVLAAGGCLLTDRLSAQAGLESLFRDGEHLALYDSDATLLARARELLEDPAEARRIARAGHAAYEHEHTPGRARIHALTTWIDGGGLDDRWDIRPDRRSRSLRSVNAADLHLRLAAYETIQEWHRAHGASGHALGLVAWPDVDARLLVDLLDLPRLRLAIRGEPTDMDPVARRWLVEAGVWNQLRFVTDDGAAQAVGPALAGPAPAERVDGYLLSTDAFLATEPRALAQLARGRQLLVATRSDAEARLVLARQPAFASEGYLAQATAIPSFEQKNPVVKGEIAVMEGRLDDALQFFQSALTADPEYVEALNNLGVLAQQAGDDESAASFLERAIRLDRGHVAALTNLASLFEQTDHLDEAESLLLAASAADPGLGNVDVWQQLAQLRHRRGDDLGARDALLRLAALDPGREGVADALRTLRASKAPPQAGSSGEASRPPRAVAARDGAPMRILVLNNLYPPQELGGYGRLMADFAGYLTEMGHTVHVLTSDTPYLGPIREPEAHVTRALHLYGGWKDGRTEELAKDAAIACARDNHLTLARIIGSFHPDVAFIGNIDFVAPNIFAPLLERGVPVLHYLANGQPGFSPGDAPRSPLYRALACSRWLADRIRATYPLPDTGVLYPGARVSDYKMPLPPLRRRLHIAYASLVMPYKGAHVLMGALEELSRRRVDFTCTIAGHSTDAAFLAHLGARAQAPGLRGRVTFPGLLDRARLRALFARSNVLAFPSVFEEPFGISQVEAMAAGLTVVTSGTGGASEIVEHERSGVVFPTESCEGLADALAGLPADPARWERLGDAGQARAFAELDMRQLADALAVALRALTEATRRDSPPARRHSLPVVNPGPPRA